MDEINGRHPFSEAQVDRVGRGVMSNQPTPRHWYRPALVWHREWCRPRFTRWDDKFPTFSPVRTLDLGPITLTWWGGSRS